MSRISARFRAHRNFISGRRAFRQTACWILCVFQSLQMAWAIDYTTEIQPILKQRCYACHGALEQKAKLRLDTVEAMIRGGKSGPAIHVSHPEDSALLKRVTAASIDDRMPPEHEGEPLTPDQIARLRKWIEAGAPHPAEEHPEQDPAEHWAFKVISRPAPPAVSNRRWVRNPIDAFISAKFESRGLTPNLEAPRDLLIRRLFLDLIGLPPSDDDLAHIPPPSDPAWYEKTVDRLLADPRYGERWARHWMDIWRYSDWWGLGDQLRNSQKHIWHWRDWIVESLNTDLSYDEMIRLMLAADEVAPNDLSKLRATGFLARNYFLFNRNQWMEETVEHVSKSFLGLTLNCAKCHDHKFDPIPQADFYRMRAFFEPYQVRVDVLPGEVDLAKDGLPRVFDAQLDAKTYRFRRGQEKDPDLSGPVDPGLPKIFPGLTSPVRPVSLPPEAWQPERRTGVLESYEAAARHRLERAEATWKEKEKVLSKVATPKDGLTQTNASQMEARTAQRAYELAQAEWESIQKRRLAMNAEWHQAPDLESAAIAAAASEKRVVSARAHWREAEAQWKLATANTEKKAAAEKELKEAHEQVVQAEKAMEGFQTNKTFTRLIGGSWTPTRFLDSTKDDPTPIFPTKSSGRRKALADWITDRRNPLTARVAVNHLWLRHFGTPLVASVFDLGRKNPTPLHPELIDWMASELMEHGWSLKHLHRLLVTSATYRLSSSLRGMDANQAKDPDNRYWWRRQPIRIEAQVVRDSILAYAGELDLTQGGPPVEPALQEASKRRSLYFFHSNNDRNLFLTTFDDATVKECYRREQSVVPQQALAMANSKLTQDAAEAIAKRFSATCASGLASSTTNPTQLRLTFIRHAFRQLLGFLPNAQEEQAVLSAWDEWDPIETPAPVKESPRSQEAHVRLVWALLNHNDFVTLR